MLTLITELMKTLNHIVHCLGKLVEFLYKLDKPGATLEVVADKFKIGKTTVSDIKKQRQSLLADFNHSNLNNKDKKIKRAGKLVDIEEALSTLLRLLDPPSCPDKTSGLCS